MRAIRIRPALQVVEPIELAKGGDDVILSALGGFIGGKAEVRYRYANGDVLYVDGPAQYAASGGEITPMFHDVNRSLFCSGVGMIIGTADGHFADVATGIEDVAQTIRFSKRYPDPSATYPARFKAGDRVTVKGGLATRNSAGGTEMLKLKSVETQIVRIWYDYETGYRCLGRVTDAEVAAAIRAQATSRYGSDWTRENRPGEAEAILRAVEAELNWDPELVSFYESDIRV